MRGIVLGVSLVGLTLSTAWSESPAELAKAKSRYVTVEGLKVHYKTAGKGKTTLVFVHGWSCNLEFWRFQVAPLAARARLILIDLPGHGASDKPKVTYSQELLAAAVDAVLTDSKVDRAVLVGHSNGTPVIRQVYRLYPHRVQALVSVDGSLRPFWKEKAEFDTLVAMFHAPHYKEAVSKLVDGLTSLARPELRDEIRTAMLATPQHVMASSFEGIGRDELWKPDPIHVPLLVVVAKSPFWGAEYEAFVKSLGADVDYRVMEGVSHFLMMDKPGEFNAALVDFLTTRRLLPR